MASYLLGMQTRRRTDLRLEKEAEERDSRRSGKTHAVDDSDSSMESDYDDKGEEEDEEEVIPTRRSKTAQKALYLDTDDDEADAVVTIRKNRVPGKRKSPPGPFNESPAKKAKTGKSIKQPVSFVTSFAKTKKNTEENRPVNMISDKNVKSEDKPDKIVKFTASPVQSINPPNLSWSRLPSKCPECDEELPNEPNARINSLFSQLRHHVKNVGDSGPGVEFLRLQFCGAIQQEINKDEFFVLGDRRNWPEMIDYALLVKRTQRLRPYLISMIEDESILVKSDIWSTFLESIDYKIFEFGAADSVLGYTHALFARRAGYYGPKGQFVLNSTIVSILADEQDSLAGSLHRTIHDIISANPESFDEYDAESDLIHLQDFVSFILVPFTAALLIAEDLDLDLEDAAKIRDASNEYGDVLQPDNGDDDIIEHLHEENIKAMKDCRTDFLRPAPRALRAPLRLADSEAEVDEENNKRKSVKATGLSLKDFKFEDEKPDKGAPALVNASLFEADFRFIGFGDNKVTVPLPPDIEKSNKKSKAKAALTVDDFVEPDPVAKKTAKKPKEKKTIAKQTKENKTAAPKVKKNPVQSNYGTRAKSKAVESLRNQWLQSAEIYKQFGRRGSESYA
ncbi:hypothetical protein K438DRAFT_1766746 [Mycena galopus ATCC 62051]|nr:hypothetical protein K438DRAFT_1766746 [Mycena galopus ATCC 62051]